MTGGDSGLLSFEGAGVGNLGRRGVRLEVWVGSFFKDGGFCPTEVKFGGLEFLPSAEQDFH